MGETAKEIATRLAKEKAKNMPYKEREVYVMGYFNSYDKLTVTRVVDKDKPSSKYFNIEQQEKPSDGFFSVD